MLMSTAITNWSQEEVAQFVTRAKKIYTEKLAAVLEPEHRGMIVGIAPETEAYFIGEDEVSAAELARASGHEGPLYFVRVGSNYAHRWISPRL